MVKVFSKIKLDEKLRKSISIELKNKYQIEENEIDFEIDKSILSGIKIIIDSEVIDLTLNSRLEKIFELFE